MHIFRWLMTHPIVTAWILAALAILLNLNMGTKGDHDKVGHEAGHDEKVVHEVVGSESHAKTEVQADATNKETGKNDQAEKDGQSDSLKTSQQVKSDSSNDSSHAASGDASSGNTTVSASEAFEKTDDSQSSSTGQVVAAAALASVPAVAKLSNADAPSAGKQEAGAESEQVNSEGLSSMRTEQLIQLAREAFWQGDKEKSVAIYQALIEREPASLSHKGELANVYWHQEKQKESAALYAEIAIPMVKEGKSKEVANMLGFIGVFFPEKAAELQALISQ